MWRYLGLSLVSDCGYDHYPHCGAGWLCVVAGLSRDRPQQQASKAPPLQFAPAGPLAWEHGEPGQVGNEAATAVVTSAEVRPVIFLRRTNSVGLTHWRTLSGRACMAQPPRSGLMAPPHSRTHAYNQDGFPHVSHRSYF